MSTGRVFSIEEFSLFDGDGIRTTVFLKGCPLRCEWCHSPESQFFDICYLKSPNGCLHCNACLEAAFKKSGKREINENSIDACPRRLIRKCGEDISHTDLCERLLLNKDILNATSGGVTFSGGEPTMQKAFLLDCLKYLEGKIDRAIQTCGYCDPNVFNEILKNCDQILFDLKIFDRDRHFRYTGAYNDSIKTNFINALNSSKRITPRMPLIPTVTDTEENVESFCKWLSSLGVKYVELLRYNKFTKSKYTLLGKKWAPSFDEKIESQIRDEIYRKYNIKYKVV